MRRSFERPSILSEEMWERLNPSEISDEIYNTLEEIDAAKNLSEAKIHQMHIELLRDLYKLNNFINKNLETLEREQMTLVDVIETGQLSSAVSGKYSNFAYEISHYITLINGMSSQAELTAGRLMIFFSTNK